LQYEGADEIYEELENNFVELALDQEQAILDAKGKKSVRFRQAAQSSQLSSQPISS